MILLIWQWKTVKSYPEKSYSQNYRHPFDSIEDVWNSGWKIFYLRLYLSWYLLVRTANVIIKLKRFCIIYKRVTVLGGILSLIVSTFLISCLLISCYSWMSFLSCNYAKKQQCQTYRYTSLTSKGIRLDSGRQYWTILRNDVKMFKTLRWNH